MAELKTRRNKGDVKAFLNSVTDDRKRQEGFAILEMMKQVTGLEPEMWGDSIVGFGSYHYRYASGREGDWFLTGFSPRAQNLTLYIMAGFDDYDGLLKQLGRHSTGKSCLWRCSRNWCGNPWRTCPNPIRTDTQFSPFHFSYVLSALRGKRFEPILLPTPIR